MFTVMIAAKAYAVVDDTLVIGDDADSVMKRAGWLIDAAQADVPAYSIRVMPSNALLVVNVMTGAIEACCAEHAVGVKTIDVINMDGPSLTRAADAR